MLINRRMAKQIVIYPFDLVIKKHGLLIYIAQVNLRIITLNERNQAPWEQLGMFIHYLDCREFFHGYLLYTLNM